MGHGLVFLTVGRIAFGVDRLLEFMTDRAAVESHRPPIRPGCNSAAHTVLMEDFGDGMAFQLRICSRLPVSSEASSVDPVVRQLLATITAPGVDSASELNDLGIEMLWHSVELPPPELLLPSGDGRNPGLDAFWKVGQSWILGVDVCEGCYAWIVPKKNPALCKARSLLDGYAQPRLILPEKDAADFREDFIALIALFAAKAKCLAPRDEQLPEFFRSYCNRFFGGVRMRKELSEPEWLSVVDRVFERLYSGKLGMGFTMPTFPLSFRAYIARAIRGQAASAA